MAIHPRDICNALDDALRDIHIGPIVEAARDAMRLAQRWQSPLADAIFEHATSIVMDASQSTPRGLFDYDIRETAGMLLADLDRMARWIGLLPPAQWPRMFGPSL